MRILTSTILITPMAQFLKNLQYVIRKNNFKKKKKKKQLYIDFTQDSKSPSDDEKEDDKRRKEKLTSQLRPSGKSSLDKLKGENANFFSIFLICVLTFYQKNQPMCKNNTVSQQKRVSRRNHVLNSPPITEPQNSLLLEIISTYILIMLSTVAIFRTLIILIMPTF